METVGFLSKEAENQLIEGILNIAEKIAIERVQQKKKRYLMQKEVLKVYHMSHCELKRLEMLGLPKRKQGKSWYYDIKDIDVMLANLKQ